MNSSDGFFGLTDNAAKEKALIWGKDWNRLDDAEKDRFRMLAKIDGMNALSSIKAPGKISTPLGDVGVSDAVRTTSSLATYLPVLGAGARTFAALGKNALPAAVIAAEFPDKAIEVAKGDKNVFEAATELGIDAAGMRAIAPIMEKAVKVGEGAKTALGGQLKGGLTNIAGQTAVGIGQQAATALVQGRGNLSGEEISQNALTNIGLSLLDVRGGIKDARLQKDLEGYKRTAKPDIKTVGDDTYTKVDEVDGKIVVDVTKKDGTVERKEMPKKEWVLADTPHSFTSGKYVTDVPTVDHVISRGENKGKIVKGVLATDITGEQARAIDPYAFKKDNGYFIRLSHVERPEGYVAPDADIPTVGKLRKDFPGIQAAYSELNGKPHMVVSKDMLAGLDGREKVKAERALRKSGFEKIGNMFVYEYGDTLPSDFAPKQAPAEPKRIFDGYEFGIRQEGDKFIVEEGKNDIATFDDVDAAKGYVNKFEKIPEAKVDNTTPKEPTLVDNIVTKEPELVDNKPEVTPELTKPAVDDVKVDESTPATDVGNKRLVVNPKDLQTHPDFQNRKEAFSKATYDKIIAEGWNWDKYVPIKVWQDPKTNEYFTLNHTRRQAALDLGIDKLPVEVIEAKTFAEARDLARDSNNLGTPETPLERSGRYRDLWGTESNTSIDKKAKQNEGSNKELVLALSRLDPQSKALQDLQLVDKSPDRDSYNQIEKYAKWTGKLQSYFSEFSRKQQNEVYEYLRDNKDVKSFDVLRDYVQRAYDKAYFEGFDASKPLNLKQAKDIHPEELRFNEKLNIAKSEYELAKKEFDSKKELAIAQGVAVDSHPAILESKERLRATENVYRDLLRNKADILAKIRGEEQGLFGERADSRVPGGKGGERIKDFKVRLVDAVEKGEYNKQEFAAGDEVYRYSAESKGNEMPTEGIIKNLANMPVFFDPKTKRMSLIDENVVRVGTPHPLTQKNGRAVPYIISQMANNLAKSLDVTNGYGLFTGKRRFGYFKGDTKNNSSYIGINRDIFVDPNQVSQTLGHEIGHFLDWASRTFNKKTLREKVIPENQVKMFDKMLENYGKIANDLPELDGVLQKELENLSKEWSPDDNPDVDYRYSPKELYAEYVSALLNEDLPLIERVAPNFHKAFLNKLNERPEVRAAYESLKNDLNPDNPKVWEAKLDADIKKNADSRERMREIMEEDEKATKKAVKKPMQHFDYYYPVEAALREKEAAYYDVLKKAGVTEKERGAYIEAKRNIKNGVDVEANQEKITKQAKKLGADKMAALQEASKILGDNLYWSELRESIMDLRLSSESQAEIVDEVDGMLKDIRDLDLEWTIPVYLENTAIIGKHREGKGNPGFSDPFAAQKTLDAMKERIGEDNYIAVEKAGEAFHGTQLDELRLFGEDMITQEALQSLEDHADSYARFQSMVDDKLMPYYSRSGVKGMLDQTRDVLVTGTLQKMTMRHARLLNDAKKTVVELHDGKEAKVVNKNANGKKRYAPPRPGFDIIEVREKGELKGYVVDQYIADIFAKANNSNMWEWYTHWMNLQRTNLITLNAGWWMNNPIRDTFRNVKNVGFGVLAETPKAFKAAIDMQRGVPNALVDEATKAGALNHRMRSGWIDGAQPVEKVLRSKDEKVSLLQKASNFVMKPLEVVEAVNRLSAHSYLRKKGMSPKEAAFHSRQFASTPDSSVSGYSTAKMNRILMFSKMTVNGIMSDARVMRNPSTRKGVIARAMITTVIPKVMTGLAAYGVLGDIAEEVFGEDSEITETLKAVGDLYAAIPEYDLLRFTCIPIGLSKNEDGKLMIEYVRLADDPNYTAVANMILGLVGKVAQGEPDEAISDVVEQFYQAMPGAAPVIDAGLAWSDYLLGSGDPTDKFRKQSVLTTNESNSVKGAPIGEKIASDAGKEMGLWTLQKIMGANYSLFVAPHVSPRHDPSFRFGVYANNPAYSSERREVEGEARRDAAGMSLEASKIIDSKDTQEIENAYRSGLLTEKQYRRGMKEAGMSDEETNLRDKPTKILLKLQAHAKRRGLNTDYDLITKVLESRNKKSKFKGVGGNSGKSALLGK